MLKLPSVQTYLVQKITNEISQITKTKVSIKSVNYKFFKSLTLDDLYVEDTEGDTLISIAEVEVSLANIRFAEKKINFSSVKLTDGQFNLITTNDTLNLDKLLERLSGDASGDSTAKNESFSVSTKQLKLNNFRFSLQDRDDTDETIPSQINFSDLRVDSIYLSANNIKIVADTIFFDISHLGFREKSGFHLIEISTGKKSYVCSHRAFLPELSIIDDYTYLKFEYYAMNFPNGSDDIDDYLNRVRMEANIDGGYLAFKTIGFFAHDLASNNIVVFPQGKVNGTVADMHTENFNIQSATGFTSITGNFSFKGLPEIDSTNFTCNNVTIYTNIKDINATLKQITQTGENILGKEFEPFTNIDFSGNLNGHYNKFTVKGLFNTNLGTVETKTLFDFSSVKSDFEFNGDLILADFDLGKLAGFENVKNVSLNLDKMRGMQPVNGEFDLYAKGKISDLIFNDRKYNNIDIEGNISNNAFNGDLVCHDESLKFGFSGNVNMNKTEQTDYRFVFTANVTHADLYRLKIKTNDTASAFSGKIVANLYGKGVYFNGTLKLQNAKYKDSYEVINIDEIQMNAKQTENTNKISLKSSYFDAEYKGDTGFGGFLSNVKFIMSKYVPNINSNDTNNIKNGNYELNVRAKKIRDIAQIISPELFIAENTAAKLKIDEHSAKLDVQSDFTGFGDIIVKSINLKSEINSKFVFDADCKNMTIEGLNFKNLSVNGNIIDNEILTEINYDNKTESVNKGTVNIQTQILKNNDENIYYRFKIKPSQIIINGAAWNFSMNEMIIKKKYFEVSKFNAVSGEQKIFVNGIYSAIPNTSMNLELTKLDMKNFNPVFESEGYKFEGQIFGKAQIANIGGNSMFSADINTTDIYANNWLLGKIAIKSRWKEETKSMEFSSQITKNQTHKLNVQGSYMPNKDYYDLTFNAKNFELKTAEPLIAGELNGIKGNLSGILNLKGKAGKLNLLGNATLDSLEFTVDFLKTHYIISSPVSFVENAIKIQNATLYDMQNNTGRLNIVVKHENLKNFVFDINVNANKLLGLNTTKNDSNDFYGKAYISGLVRINGKLDDLDFNINIRPEKNTKIVIPVNSAVLSEKTLLTFETYNAAGEQSNEAQFMEQIKKNKAASTAKSDLNISLALTMNRNAEVEIVLDENSGDAITVTGSGILQMNINPREEKFKLYGNYIIDNGKFKWTLPMLNFVAKEFSINSGSQINFNGDMNATKINITADYVRPLRLSLRNLLADTTISSAKYPVVCRVQLTDNISNFKIKPVIDIQNIDVDTKARAQSMLNTDEKLWKQFSFLLAFGNFIPEEQMGSIISNASITSNISEILSNQLSAWLASLKVPVDLGVDIRTGNASNETEFDAHASVKMFEDRVEITGNIGSAPRTSTSDVAGNFDVDIKLNSQGSLKLKGFSHSTDEYTDDTETSRQGIRISYHGGFNTWGELWNSIFRSKKSRQRRENFRQRRYIQDSINSAQQNQNEFEIKSDSTAVQINSGDIQE
ncbi:MAG: translocation/assembly module TamB [Prevotellaceae bacterium]|nr:translocation/assembly module TamB [Prevotellaceae bacterium]